MYSAISRIDLLIGGFLATLLSATSILVLCYSLVGSGGNAIFSGTLMVLAEFAILALSFRPDIRIVAADYLFAAFLACVGASFAINGRTADIKEWEIFAVSLAAYPACRFIAVSRLPKTQLAFIVVTGFVVAIGTIVTGQALLSQWNDLHGKPIVFGFSAAALMFLGSLGLLLIALATTPLTRGRTAVISAVTFVPIAIFAASQVRFTFIAIIASLCLAAILSDKTQRKYILVITIVALVGICAGLAARWGTTKTFIAYAVQETKAVEETKEVKGADDKQSQPGNIQPPSSHLEVNPYNSVAIRQALLKDAVAIIPFAGPFGLGLDSFMGLSNIPSAEIHNSPLQAIVEFGWLGGAAFVLLVTICVFRLLSPARETANARFVLCSLAYAITISLAHGRVSRDILLFAILGLASGTFESYRALPQRQEKPAIS
jgi:hypothetical protein